MCIRDRYRDREESYEEVARYIRAATKMRVGNYLVFFPSYQYLKNVLDVYLNMWPDDKVIVQKRNMDDREREEFLNEFHALPAERMTAFAVMGGIFSEGIDLTGERLSGAVIVGVGLPQISAERDLTVSYTHLHVDFMFGTEDLEIDGETKDGQQVPVFRNGNFA